MLLFSKAHHAAFFILVLLALNACGFQVRGSANIPQGMSVVYIDTEDRYSSFYRELTTVFIGEGITLTRDPLVADTVFRILRDETGQRVLSVSARNTPVEFDVFYIINYSVHMQDNEVLAPQQLTRTRDYTYDETEVLGKALEERTYREALAADLVGLVMQSMSSINGSLITEN
jgi:LPS-assembly lipoprotein